MDIRNFQIERLDEEAEKKLLGVSGWFLKGEKRESLLISKLVKRTLKEKMRAGERLTPEEIDKINFAYDPLFKQKIINKIHHNCDKIYYRNIKKCENNIKELERAKSRKIKKIEESRWENIVDKSVRFNITEGKLFLNGAYAYFDSIRGAKINIKESYRIEVEKTEA